jgi:hypothetical protein
MRPKRDHAIGLQPQALSLEGRRLAELRLMAPLGQPTFNPRLVTLQGTLRSHWHSGVSARPVVLFVLCLGAPWRCL